MNRKRELLRSYILTRMRGDIQLLGSVCAFWYDEEEGLRGVPQWARDEVARLMHKNDIEGSWRDGFRLALREEEKEAPPIVGAF